MHCNCWVRSVLKGSRILIHTIRILQNAWICCMVGTWNLASTDRAHNAVIYFSPLPLSLFTLLPFSFSLSPVPLPLKFITTWQFLGLWLVNSLPITATYSRILREGAKGEKEKERGEGWKEKGGIVYNEKEKPIF